MMMRTKNGRIDLQAFLKNKYINKWWLFSLVAIPMSAIIAVELMRTGLSVGEDISHMIGYSVRFAVPFIFLVVAASAVQTLFPGPIPMWSLRNRKYIGFCFVVAMAWQGSFIFIMSNFFRDYYYADIYLLRDELEGSIGYIFIPAMVVTSFHFGRKYLTQKQWSLLHTSGIYFLFAYPFSVYWWNTAHYYGEPDTIDYVFYWMGFLAFAARIAAWGKRRLKAAAKDLSAGSPPFLLRIIGGIVIGLGLYAAATGAQWQKATSEFLLTPQWAADLELWFPYWPFEPFLPLLVIGLGTWLLTTVSRVRAAG